MAGLAKFYRGTTFLRKTVMRPLYTVCINPVQRDFTTNFIININRRNTCIPNHVIQKCSYYCSAIHLQKNNISFKLSDIGEGIKEVIVKEWFVKVGDTVSQFDNVCEVQSDKASVTITSRYDGTITKLHYNVDDTAFVGQALIDLDIEVDADVTPDISQSVNVKPVVAAIPVQMAERDYLGKILATPAVRRIAMENKIMLKAIQGSGKGGRVLKEDLLAYLDGIKDTSIPQFMPVEVEAIEPLDRMEPIQGIMKVMVKTMTSALKIPHFVYTDEVNVSKLVDICSEVKRSGFPLKVTYLPFFIKAASKALDEFPIINSCVDEDCKNISFRSAHNIGVAIDLPQGLIVPNIKDVRSKSILAITRELNTLRDLATKGSLTTRELTGGTFTLSNIGSLGGTYMKPIIVPTEVAIGAIGKIQVLPRFDAEDNVVKARVMCVSWSADHRVIDGATMARFSNMWKRYLENPYLLMLDF